MVMSPGVLLLKAIRQGTAIGAVLALVLCYSINAVTAANESTRTRYTAVSSGSVSVLQGLASNTLVAGKTTAFRIFTSSAIIGEVSNVRAQITGPDGSEEVLAWTSIDYFVLTTSTNGPSIVVKVPGNSLPWVGLYRGGITLVGTSGETLASLTMLFDLLPTKDVRVLVNRIWSGCSNPGSINEIQGVRDAMTRFAALLPIRDGINALDGDRTSGLRYNFINNPCEPGTAGCDDCALFKSWTGRPQNVDSIDTAVEYRAPDACYMEDCGANSRHQCQGVPILHAGIVWSPDLSMVFAQEIGHNFGLEPPEDPHYDPDGQSGHSKDQTIDIADAQLGFDGQFNTAFPSVTYDTMFPSGACPGYSASSVSYNAWDWEYLRTQLAQLPSTGPSIECALGPSLLSVPSQYSTVVGAYNASATCKIIKITAGVYREAPLMFDKHVRLEAQGGAVTIRQ